MKTNQFGLLIAACGMTQSELAKRLGIHPNTVTNWAKGKPMPGPAVAYMRLYAKVKDLLNE